MNPYSPQYPQGQSSGENDANMQRQIDALNFVLDQPLTQSHKGNVYQQYLDMVSGDTPDRNQQLQEAQLMAQSNDPLLKRKGEEMLHQLMGINADSDYQMNLMAGEALMPKFLKEFGMDTNNSDILSRNADLQGSAAMNPSLVSQYYGSEFDPNFLDKVAGRAESMMPNWGVLGGEANTYDEIMSRRRLEKSGLPTEGRYNFGQ